MDEELQKTRAFADLIERRTGVRLDDADAHILHLRLLRLYRLLIRKPPVKPGSRQDIQQEEREAA